MAAFDGGVRWWRSMTMRENNDLCVFWVPRSDGCRRGSSSTPARYHRDVAVRIAPTLPRASSASKLQHPAAGRVTRNVDGDDDNSRPRTSIPETTLLGLRTQASSILGRRLLYFFVLYRQGTLRNMPLPLPHEDTIPFQITAPRRSHRHVQAPALQLPHLSVPERCPSCVSRPPRARSSSTGINTGRYQASDPNDPW